MTANVFLQVDRNGWLFERLPQMVEQKEVCSPLLMSAPESRLNAEQPLTETPETAKKDTLHPKKGGHNETVGGMQS